MESFLAGYNLDQVDTDVVKTHVRPQGCVPDSVKCFLEIHKDVVEVLLVLKVFLTQYSEVEDLVYFTAPCPEASLFFCNDFLCLRLQSVQYDPQHDFAWVAS